VCRNIRYNLDQGPSITTPLRSKGLEFRSPLLLHFEIRQQSRPWECGNPEEISKECGKGGKPTFWLSMLSILCHFHGCFGNAYQKITVTAKARLWEQEPLVRNADYSSRCQLPSYAWACGPPIGMKIVSSLRLDVIFDGVADNPTGIEVPAFGMRVSTTVPSRTRQPARVPESSRAFRRLMT
jgi:hypothetical protein